MRRTFTNGMTSGANTIVGSERMGEKSNQWTVVFCEILSAKGEMTDCSVISQLGGARFRWGCVCLGRVKGTFYLTAK